MTEAANDNTDNRKTGWTRVFPVIAIGLAVGLSAVLGYVFLGDYLSLDTLKDNREALLTWRDENYLLSVIAFIGIYIAVFAFSLPGGALMTLTGGFLFGMIPGTIFTLIGATTGASILFLAAKTCLGDMLKRKAGPWMQKFEAGFKRNELSFLFLIRLVPAIPYFVANLLPAFFGVKLTTYIWTTFLGMMPGSVVYTSVGTGLGEMFARGEKVSLNVLADPKIWAPLLGLIALALLPIIVNNFRGQSALLESNTDV